jgi:hypothetical protein
MTCLIYPIEENIFEVYMRITFTRYRSWNKGEEVIQSPYALNYPLGISARARAPDEALCVLYCW